MAMAERFLRERYGREVQDHRVFAIVSDGDLMEGVAAEAASLAGHLGLGRMVYLYDDNRISLDGPTEWSYAGEDVTKRFEAYRWHVQQVDDANDLNALEVAIDKAMREEERPSLIRVRSIIGWPVAEQAEHEQGARRAARRGRGPRDEGGPRLGPGRALPRARRRLRALQRRRPRRRAAGRVGRGASAQWRDAGRRPRGRVGRRVGAGGRCRASPTRCATIDWGKDKLATRAAGQKAMAAFADYVPTMVGGAADLSESTKTEFPGGDDQRYTRDHAGRNVFFGVREHGMGGVGQRHVRPRRDRAAVRLDVPAVRRLHARLDAPERAHGPAASPGSTRTTRSASARTARRTSRSSTSRRCARSRA